MFSGKENGGVTNWALLTIFLVFSGVGFDIWHKARSAIPFQSYNVFSSIFQSVSRKKGTPARTPARSTRKTTRGNSHLDSANDFMPETLNFDKEVDKITNSKVQNIKDSDKEVVSESDTDNEMRSRLGQGQSNTKTDIKSRLGHTKTDEGQRGGKRTRQSSKNDEEKSSEVIFLFTFKLSLPSFEKHW